MKPRDNQKQRRTTQQMMQPLESRRLMSLTAGVEFPSAGGPPVNGGFTQIVHSFGFEPAAPALDEGAGALGVSFGPGPSPLPDFDAEAFDQQLAHAIATGKPISITPSDAPSTQGVSLSTLYSSLPSSTVAQIDAANVQSQTSSLLRSLIDRIDSALSTTIVESQLTQTTPQFSGIDSSWTAPAVTSEKSLAAALSVIASPVSTSTTLALPSASAPTPPSWGMIHNLDQELTAVRAFSSQLIGDLARDGAIALAHLESATISVIESAESVVSTAGWRSLAVAGAAVAAVTYLQNETKHRNKSASIFSSRLIETID